MIRNNGELESKVDSVERESKDDFLDVEPVVEEESAVQQIREPYVGIEEIILTKELAKLAKIAFIKAREVEERLSFPSKFIIYAFYMINFNCILLIKTII